MPRVFPSFSWRDPTIPRPSSGTYSYWGSGEPNSGGSQLCGGSSTNYTDPVDNVWGWADEDCSSKQIYLCRIMRKWWSASSLVRPTMLSCPACLLSSLLLH